MADMDTYDVDQRGYEDERDYPPRDRSRSPGQERDRDGDVRLRDEPSNGRAERGPPAGKRGDDEESANTGSNLFVTGIHPSLDELEIRHIFEKYGTVEKCNIMRDPHTRDSRGFGFVKMMTAEEADTAKTELQGHSYEGRTLSIEKARRGRPRTPTPGKYFGPPKREDRAPRGGYRDRFDDRGYGRRDDFRRGGPGGGGYRDRYDDRGSGRRDDYRERRGEDRYGGDRGDRGDRRGGYGGGGYDRPPRGPPAESSGYGGDSSFHDSGSRGGYDDRRRYD